MGALVLHGAWLCHLGYFSPGLFVSFIERPHLMLFTFSRLRVNFLAFQIQGYTLQKFSGFIGTVYFSKTFFRIYPISSKLKLTIPPSPAPVSSLFLLVNFIVFVDGASSLLQMLVLFSYDKEATELQKSIEELISLIKKSMNEIWKHTASVTQTQPAIGPQSTVNSILANMQSPKQIDPEHNQGMSIIPLFIL